jgi:hypothetical protein
MSSKTQQKLLRADVATRTHYPAERVRNTTAETQKGAVVVGEQSIVFLAQGAFEGAETIVLSHPISMVAQYKAVGDTVDYSLKKEHLLKHSELLEFRYKLYSPEQAAKVVAAIDASVLINTKLAAHDKSADDLALLDPEIQSHQAYARAHSTVGEEVQRIAGERFKCNAVYYNDKPHFLDAGPERETVLAIVNARGIALLHHASNELEIFSWTQISAFGPKVTIVCFVSLPADTFAPLDAQVCRRRLLVQS